MYRPLKPTNNCIACLLTKGCCDNTKWCYIAEDLVYITWIALGILSISDCHWLEFIIYPNIFISIVLSTVLWLCMYCNGTVNGYESIDAGSVVAVVFIPIGIIVSICLFPFLFFRYLCQQCAMEKYMFLNNGKYQQHISKYLLNRSRSENGLIHPILAINYHFLSRNESKYRNDAFLEHVESKNNNGKPLGLDSWSNIRQISRNRKNCDLGFSLAVNIFVVTYRIYHLLFISYVWIYYYPHSVTMQLRDVWEWSVWSVLILNIIVKCFIFIKFIVQMRISFVMFHILIPMDLIQHQGNQDEAIEDIQEIENILISAEAQRYELIRTYDQYIGPEIINIILEYSTYTLPIGSNKYDII